MKKITLFIAMLCFSIVGFSQFNETFEGTLPAGFTVVNNGSANGWVFLDNPTGGAHGGTGVASITYDAALAHDDYLITSQISVTAGVSDQLSFWIKSRSGTFLEPYEVLLSTTDTAPASFTTTLQASEDAASVWEEKIFDLTTYVGQNIYVAIRATGTNEWQLFVDDMVNSAIPACPNVMNIAAGNFSGPSSADLSWDAVAGATGYNWEIQPQGTAQGTAGAVDSGTTALTSVTTSSLVDGTDYTLYVQSDCGGATGVYQSIDFSFVLPPSNNDCANAIALTVNPDSSCTAVTSGTIEAATASGEDEATCGGTEDDDVWYSFVATSTSHNISLLNVAGSTTDLYHSVWSGTCGALTNLNCSDPNTSSVSGLTIGNTYLLRVYSWTGTAGQNTTFDVCIGTPPAPPANNDCANAIALTVNPDASCTAVTSGTIESATASGEDEATCGGTEDDDVWYSFVATSTTHDISLLNVAGSTTDLYHSVWSGTCGALTNINCSDPNTSNVTGLTIGNTYLLRVYSWTGTAGQNTTFDVCIGTPPAPPANDDLCNAIPLTIDVAGVSGAYTNQSATVETNEPAGSCYTGGAQGTVWFSFVAPASGEVQVSTDIGGTMTDSEIAVYDATGVTCADLSTLPAESGCDQDGGTTIIFNSILNLNAGNGNALTPGNTYYIQVSGYNDNRGTFGIQVFDEVTLGIDDLELSESFRFYPNPVNNVLNVSAKNNISALQVVNMLGQTVKTAQPNSTDYQLDFSDLTTGVYFVKATVNDTEGTFRIIKK